MSLISLWPRKHFIVFLLINILILSCYRKFLFMFFFALQVSGNFPNVCYTQVCLFLILNKSYCKSAKLRRLLIITKQFMVYVYY